MNLQHRQLLPQRWQSEVLTVIANVSYQVRGDLGMIVVQDIIRHNSRQHRAKKGIRCFDRYWTEKVGSD